MHQDLQTMKSKARNAYLRFKD